MSYFAVWFPKLVTRGVPTVPCLGEIPRYTNLIIIIIVRAGHVFYVRTRGLLLLLLLLLPRSPHSDVHTSLLDEGSTFSEILWAAVELCLQGCDCWPFPCSQVVGIRTCLEDRVWSHLSRVAGAVTIRSNAKLCVSVVAQARDRDYRM